MRQELPPKPERENTAEAKLFNVDAMSDDQIVALYRAFEQKCGEMYPGLDGRINEGNMAQDLLNRLVAEAAGLASRDWERVENLVTAAMHSTDEMTGCLAAEVAGALAPTHYSFARDVLITLAAARDERGEAATDTVYNLESTGLLELEQSAELVALHKATYGY